MMVEAHYLIASECMAVTSAMRKNPRWANAGIASILGASSDSSTRGDSLDKIRLRKSSEENVTDVAKDGGEDLPSVAGSGADNVTLPGAPPTITTNGHQGTSHTETAKSERRNSLQPSSEPSLGTTYQNDSSVAVNYPETQLILGFSATRSSLVGTDPQDLSALTITRPFLEVIKSPLVSGNVTSLALSSLEKFISLNVLSPESKDASKCANEISHALTHCRFEATDRQEDDAVLLQLMTLLEKLVVNPFGQILSGKAVIDVVETCLNMAKQMKRRDSLRCSVVNVLASLCRTLFGPHRIYNDLQELQECRTSIITILVDNLDPNKHNLSGGIRSTVMSVLGLCFEVGVQLPPGPTLLSASTKIDDVMERLWKYLAQIIRITHSPKLVQEALILVRVIMNTHPKKFKTQFEFVLIYLLTSLTPLSDLPRDDSADDMFYAGVPNRAKAVKSAPLEPGSSTLSIPTAALSKVPEIREVMIEALVSFAATSPTLFLDLFLTYDCDKASSDMCEDLIGFFCRNAYPDSANWSTSSVPPLCLEAVLSGLSFWTEMLKQQSLVNSNAETTAKDIAARLKGREDKEIESVVAETFNKSPSKGIKVMVENKLVQPNDPASLARFFHSCARINKAVLGKFFSRAENKEVLEHFVKEFDFSGLRIDESLRLFLCSFRLPGESAQIENVLQQFSDHYIATGDKPEKTSDNAFILSYAVLMLNTDQFNPTIRRRMDFERFKCNIFEAGKDLSDEYLRAIFDGIAGQEIIMPEEHDTDETFEHTWREAVVARRHSAGPFEARVLSGEVIKEIFEINWRPIVSTLSFVFATATDDLVFRRVIAGFYQLAFLASQFHSHQALTHIVASLCQISALASGDLGFPNSNIEIRIENSASVMVSDLSTQFGDDLKAQMASITLFRILNVACPELNRNAYALISKALVNLHLYGLGTPTVISGLRPLPPYHTFERSKAGKPVGIFSALSSYLTSSSDTPAEPSDESVDAALGATDCIKVCDIDGTISLIAEKSPEALAQGALDVFPQSAELKYLPAKRYLLQLAGYASQNLPKLRSQISKLALESNLPAIALTVAPSPEQAASIMDKLEIKDQHDESLQVILAHPPSPSVWRLLTTVSKPEKPVCDYISRQASKITLEHLDAILDTLKSSSDEGSSINALNSVIVTQRDLAKTDKSHASYISSLGALASFSGKATMSTRETALSDLQRELLQEKQLLSWAEAANGILIPHVLEPLLKPEVWKQDPKGMDLTRQQAASLLGKVFLHLTVSVKSPESEADTDAWIAVLKGLDRLLSSRRQPALHEGVVEMLKNVILVTQLASQGSSAFWTRMQQELKGFLPEIAELATPKTANADSAATENPAAEKKPFNENSPLIPAKENDAEKSKQ